MRCEDCKRWMRRRAKKRRHVNICQEHLEMIFCSDKCKDTYRRDRKDGNEKRVVSWGIEDQITKVAFIPKVKKEYISDRSLSHFSGDLRLRTKRVAIKLKKRVRAKV